MSRDMRNNGFSKDGRIISAEESHIFYVHFMLNMGIKL